jgi:hypothetical protein
MNPTVFAQQIICFKSKKMKSAKSNGNRKTRWVDEQDRNQFDLF